MVLRVPVTSIAAARIEIPRRPRRRPMAASGERRAGSGERRTATATSSFSLFKVKAKSVIESRETSLCFCFFFSHCTLGEVGGTKTDSVLSLVLPRSL